MSLTAECLPGDRSRARRASPLLVLAALALTLACPPGFAVSRIVLEVAEVDVPGTQAGGVQATLDLKQRNPFAQVKVEYLEVPQPIGPLRKIEVGCTRLVVREPTLACREGTLAAQGGPTKTITMNAAVEYDMARKRATAQGSDLPIAGGTAQFSGHFDRRGWEVESRATALDVKQVRALIAPWFTIPASLEIDGRFDAGAQAVSRAGSDLQVDADMTTGDLNFTNEEGTVVAENVGTLLRATAVRTETGFDVDLRLDGSAGQALAGPALLDFNTNPISLEARGHLTGETLTLNDVTLGQKDLMQARGQARVILGETPQLAQAHVDLANLEFPAAYTSFMQIALAATDFGQLKTTGTARGSLDIANNAVTQVVLNVAGLTMEDAKGKFSMSDVTADLHWAADETARVTPSRIAWNSASAYGLSGGATRLEFMAHGRGFELLRPARVPIFDGAVVVNTLVTRRLGAEDAELDFDAQIEPISMRLISAAFGWPELAGQVSGSIPGLAYRNHVLTLDGDLVASVFDGVVIGRDFRLQNPTGPWPRLFVDVTARRLDLALLTNTFSIGSITGRLDADINDLELFNWSPVSFDARLYSTPDDNSKRMISAKAVTSISNVAGGGGGVTAALQSGVMRFFDEFRYDQIGIACRLENEVCLMSGIEPAGIGYYLVRGRGLPRIDIIGNQGRVAWPQLMGQIASSINSDVVVR